MKPIVRKSLTLVSAASSLCSAFMWHLSANSQMHALELSNKVANSVTNSALLAATSPNAHVDAISLANQGVAIFTQLSAGQNLYAALFSVAAGVALAAAVFFDD